MSPKQVLVVCALGAAVFAASYAAGETMSEDEAAPTDLRVRPLAPASVELPELEAGAPLPGFRNAERTPAPVSPEPEPIEPPVETPAPPPAPPAPPAGGGGNSGGGGPPAITFDDSG